VRDNREAKLNNDGLNNSAIRSVFVILTGYVLLIYQSDNNIASEQNKYEVKP
jgi:hypothetical protein